MNPGLGIAASIDRVFATNTGSGVATVDTSSPATPALLFYDSAATGAGLLDLQGSMLYAAADSGGLYLIDASSGLTTGPLIQHPITDIDFDGDTLFVSSTTGGAFEVYDLTNPASPTLLGNSNGGASGAIRVEGAHAYVATTTSLASYDVSDPTQVQPVGSLILIGGGRLQLSGNRLYLLETTTLRVYDLADPAAPVESGSSTHPAAYRFAVVGNTAYIAAGAQGLRVVDASDPTAPQEIAAHVTPNALNVAVAGDYAFVVDGQLGLLTVPVPCL